MKPYHIIVKIHGDNIDSFQRFHFLPLHQDCSEISAHNLCLDGFIFKNPFACPISIGSEGLFYSRDNKENIGSRDFK